MLVFFKEKDTSLFIRDMHIKTTVGFHLPLIRMGKNIRKLAVLAGEDMEKSLFTARRNANYIVTVGINVGSPWKTGKESISLSRCTTLCQIAE